MNALNAALTKIGDLALAPLASSPLATLVVLSIVGGVAMTWLFGRTTNQRALGAVADRARAQLLGMKLYRDGAMVVLGYQRELFKAAGLRLVHSLPAMAVLMLPFAVILVQLAMRYEHRPLAIGERAVVELRLAPAAWAVRGDVTFEAPAGTVVETPALHDETLRTITWRVRVEEVPEAPLRWRLGGRVHEKRLAAAADVVRLRAVDPRRPGAGLVDRLLHPTEPALDGAAVEAIVVRYARRSTPVFGFGVPWWLTFLIVSMATALIVRPFLRVRF